MLAHRHRAPLVDDDVVHAVVERELRDLVQYGREAELALRRPPRTAERAPQPVAVLAAAADDRKGRGILREAGVEARDRRDDLARRELEAVFVDRRLDLLEGEEPRRRRGERCAVLSLEESGIF